MFVKIHTINGAALITGTLAALLAGGVCLAGRLPLLYVLIATPVCFGAIYLTAYFVFRRFVLFRIKPIYQVLLSKNIKTRELSLRDDPVEEIRDELNRWAEKNDREIARLKENDRYRKEFLGNVSHEIKTPIFTVQGYLLTLLDGGLEDERINRKYLERSEKSIDRLINIVQDLEEISKLESGIMALEPTRFDIVWLIREIIEAQEMEALAHKISLQVGAGPSQGPVYVYADRSRIGQVITNLITNSLKYGRPGGRTRVSFIDMFDRILVEVTDNGVGIAEEHIPRVFERFFRVDKSRSREQGGTGLGLAIVKHILEAHGQTITLRSTLGEGSTFSFALAKGPAKAAPCGKAVLTESV